ncbi:redoxin domain-containing protein [bacterium]|nr:redoxin domain-containing protein [bacterium]
MRLTTAKVLATISVISVSLVAWAQEASLGDAAPPLSVSSWVKGEPVDLTASKGERVYLIEFWGTWCPPCRESIPHLTEVQKKYGERGLVIVGISDEEAETVRPFVAKQGDRMKYTVAIDKEQKTTEAYMGAFGLDSIPSAFLVDRKGKVVWFGHPQDEELEERLERLFPEKGDTSRR